MANCKYYLLSKDKATLVLTPRKGNVSSHIIFARLVVSYAPRLGSLV